LRRLLAGAAAWALVAGTAAAQPFTFVAIGDMPYTLPDDYLGFERLITRINEVRPAFTVHVGDIKSGSSPCTDENLLKIKDYFSTFEQPLLYTPGDNEWTDCHREKAGRFDPLERLAKVRSMFFAAPQSLGKAVIPVEQGDLMPTHEASVENARWREEGIVFATVHMVGSNNGLERNGEMIAEHLRRDAANIAWIDDTFAKATGAGAPAVVFAFQADPLFHVDRLGDLAYANAGFHKALDAFAKGAETFKKPVLLIHGDAHVFIIDQPLKASDGKTVLQNLTRLEVMGAEKVHGVRVTVDPADPAVFGFFPLIVPQNQPLAGTG
jgi:hypothetical protein